MGFKKFHNKKTGYVSLGIFLVILFGLFSNKYVALFGIILFFVYAIKRFKSRNVKEAGRGETGAVRKKIKTFCYIRQGGKCGWIGCKERKYLKLHHIIPRNMGGDNRTSNLIYLCPKHHDAAHDQGDGKPSYSKTPIYLGGGFI